MHLISPHLVQPVAATPGDIADLIPRLVEGHGAYAVVAHDDSTFAQVLWTGAGFILEYRAGSADRHFRASRCDFGAQEIIAVRSAYCSRSPGWGSGIDFERTAVRRGLSFHLGRVLGRTAGSLF